MVSSFLTDCRHSYLIRDVVISKDTFSLLLYARIYSSSWVRFIFVILDLVLSLAIIYRTILFQNTPGLDTEQQHELTLIGIKQIASLQAEMVVKMILWNRFQDRKPREGNKRSFALCYWYGYMLLSFSIQLLVFLEVLKQISWLTM